MFKRKKNKSVLKRIKDFVYPDMGLYRSMQYTMNRVKRLKGHPYSIAAGLACGVAMSFTPFLGLHFLLSAVLALIIRGSLVASVIGTLVGNPITFPFIFLLIYQTGHFILGTEATATDRNIIGITLVAIEGLFQLGIKFIISFHVAIDNWAIYRPAFINLWDQFVPMLLGGLVWALVVWFVTFTLAYRLLYSYQKRTAQRRMKKRLQTKGKK